MTVLSWSLEFITGGFGIAIYFGFQFERFATRNLIENLAIWGWIIDTCLNFIIIPSSYILNNEVNKALIIAHGWYKSLRSCLRTNTINPVPNEDIERNVLPNAIPAPIPTVSGHIRTRAIHQDQQEDRARELNVIRENYRARF